ncbi:flagellar basal body-associated FliL family protein [Propionivibrio limicola]|uniref:flagellar basal body-associated FliL family protein n=1 Tax=Propionivibrio limicola TaxID=167645 RepID=UPI001290D449|nr:flagellar basal body-associated FliL family protein [Propionivibrio limicola]
MAKDAKAGTDEAAPAPKSKKMLIIVASALVLVLAIGAAAAMFMLTGHDEEEGDEEEVVTQKASSKKKKDEKETPPIYVALDTFTVNLVPENGEQFLQLVISAEVEDIPTGDKLKVYTPKLRNNVMMLLSSKRASELLTTEGKAALAEELRDLMNEILAPKQKKGEGPIKEVLFTSFIIQ